MYVFLPDGGVSCCWGEAIAEENCRIGVYGRDGLSLDTEKAQNRFARSADKIPQCAECRYFLLCAGGCPQHAGTERTSLYEPNCGDFPQTYAWVLAEAVEYYLKSSGL
jgi:radical SAM protein with 4Fe4S-binding SPASM domain